MRQGVRGKPHQLLLALQPPVTQPVARVPELCHVVTAQGPVSKTPFCTQARLRGLLLLAAKLTLIKTVIMQNARVDELQAGIKIARRNINSLKHADDTTLMAGSEEELKSLLMRVKEESEKAGLKLNIQKTRIMASSPITSWQIDGENVETVSDFIFLGSKINADGDCSHKIKRWLLLGRKAMTNLDSVFNRDITLLTKVHLVKATISPIVMYGCECWTIKKTEQRFLWTARKSNQSILKESNPEYSLGGLLLKLNLQYFCKEPTHWKRLRARGEGG